ncbi:conserved hypothetical protein [Ricinus communis]|uniref:Uncharacterized protein n=1 Tax=Ricinus communis TaxID=3988 RepID=B9RPE1_RICCO|nr:conserved hypothetical protein [Ricinus communis]
MGDGVGVYDGEGGTASKGGNENVDGACNPHRPRLHPPSAQPSAASPGRPYPSVP